MKQLPPEYIDETLGIRPGPNQGSFNNIIYSTWYILARFLKNYITSDDLKAYLTHNELNKDEYGLYMPKNSHDNITYKVIGSKVLGLKYERDMSLFQACKDIGFYRIWDVILYAFWLGGPILKFFSRFFLWIPALQMIEACANSGKVRPDWFETGEKKHVSRFYWWFNKELITEEYIKNKTIKYWKIPGGDVRISYHMQNDGKHLALFKLYVLKEESLTMKICAKICKKILEKKYGECYGHGIIKKYFDDQQHPVIKEWQGIKDIL